MNVQKNLGKKWKLVFSTALCLAVVLTSAGGANAIKAIAIAEKASAVAELNKAGVVKLGEGIITCDSSEAGSVRWNGIDFEGCDGRGWVSLTDDPVPTVTSGTGQIWMDRNLGASRVAKSMSDLAAYGWLYQWGRLTDGHEQRHSPSTEEISEDVVPGHGYFIIGQLEWTEVAAAELENYWQGVSGTNNPCPAGFRLPTDAEWQAELDKYATGDEVGSTGTALFNSPLKLVAAGYRASDGIIYSAGDYGLYWSSTVAGSQARNLFFVSGSADTNSYYPATGSSVRCVKD